MDEGSLIVHRVFLCDKVGQKKGKSFSETSNVSQQPNLKEMAHVTVKEDSELHAVTAPRTTVQAASLVSTASGCAQREPWCPRV